MKTQLIMLDTPIIVSDEKFEKKDLICFVDLENNFVVEVCKNIDNYNIDTKKIIAGLSELPSIDFNGFEEQLGIVDILYLSIEYANEVYPLVYKSDFEKNWLLNKHAELIVGYEAGFKAAQKLNEKKFSEENIKLFAIELIAKYKLGQLKDVSDVDKIIKSYSQPKVFDIEVEMEEYCLPMPNIHVKKYRPKITNNSIKIIKVL